MAQRKLQQEVDKTFKRVAEGVQQFEMIYEKIYQLGPAGNPSQKEKLEDSLKRTVKKLQRNRDQIKTWAQSSDIKDKKPLIEHRKLIETQMEKFKAVEKEMKTKAYSKEGLSAAAKLDPKEREKLETCQFLSSMVEELDRQIEALEAEQETLQANMKKGKKESAKAERIADIEKATEKHKWHQNKLELMLRSLENGGLETDQVTDLQEDIKYYVESNQDGDFIENDEIYEGLNLSEEEDAFGMNNDFDRVSSQDTQSVHDEPPEHERNHKIKSESSTSARRPSTQMKSPLPAFSQPAANLKPAPLPTRVAGETLKYASAAAAAAASDKTVGIAPLPPPPGTVQAPSGSSKAHASPKATYTQASNGTAKALQPVAEPVSKKSPATTSEVPVKASKKEAEKVEKAEKPEKPEKVEKAEKVEKIEKVEKAENIPTKAKQEPKAEVVRPAKETAKASILDSTSGNAKKQVLSPAPEAVGQENVPLDAEDAIYHLPSSLQDLLQSFEATKARVANPASQSVHRLLNASFEHYPDNMDSEKPNSYKPQTRYNTPSYFPQEVSPYFNDPMRYQNIDTDTLFYIFYYKQGTYEQYLAAKELKKQSWRFHKQYQTWFQRHEEPKTITEEYEQGTYRFFDYESTWMNRRKADFKFAYKFLEDDL